MSLFQAKTAKRSQVKLKIGMSGPSGSGKSYSALQLAYGIAGDWSKVAVADTENESALYYADLGPFQHINFPPTIPQGYHPLNWVKLIEEVEAMDGIEVLVLDSASHEWNGVGGCLELVEKVGQGFSSWKTVTPMHNKFIDKIRNSKLHIIATMRSVQDYVVEKNDKGKSAPRKVGLKSNQREGTDYEFGIIFDINMQHYASTSKDRTGLFVPRGPFQITPETGRELLAWADSGETLDEQNYDPTNQVHKRRLLDVFREVGIEDREEWKRIASEVTGIKISSLKEAVEAKAKRADPDAVKEVLEQVREDIVREDDLAKKHIPGPIERLRLRAEELLSQMTDDEVKTLLMVGSKSEIFPLMGTEDEAKAVVKEITAAIDKIEKGKANGQDGRN